MTPSDHQPHHPGDPEALADDPALRSIADRLDHLGASERAAAPAGLAEHLARAAAETRADALAADDPDGPRATGVVGRIGWVGGGLFALAAALAVLAIGGAAYLALTSPGAPLAPAPTEPERMALARLETEIAVGLDELLASDAAVGADADPDPELLPIEVAREFAAIEASVAELDSALDEPLTLPELWTGSLAASGDADDSGATDRALEALAVDLIVELTS